MKFEVNIQKKHIFVLVGAMMVLAGAIAFGGSEPSVVGHSSGEVEVDIEGTAKTLQEAIDGGDLTTQAGWITLNGNTEKDVDIDAKCQSQGYEFASGRCRIFPGVDGEAYGAVGKFKSSAGETFIYCIIPSLTSGVDDSVLLRTTQEIHCIK